MDATVARRNGLGALVTGLFGAAPWPAVGDHAPAPALRFRVDTFAFRNDSTIHHRDKPDIYSLRCFVLGRAVTQFQRCARFEPERPRLASSEYTALVRRVVAHRPWQAPLPASARVAIPGFRSLYALSEAEAAAVKAGLGHRFWTLVQPTNWRIVFPYPPSAQQRLAVRTVQEVRAGRPVQFLISDFPRIKLNHSVLVYDYRVLSEETIEFVVYDPNDQRAPGIVRFDRRLRRFVPAPLTGVDVPWFRAFRMYYCWLF